jgi:antitoxin YefM
MRAQEPATESLTDTELRKNLARALDSLEDNREPIRIVRRNRPAAILMAEDDYRSLMETAHLLRSPANVEHLLGSLAEARAGEVVEVDARALLDETGSR